VLVSQSDRMAPEVPSLLPNKRGVTRYYFGVQGSRRRLGSEFADSTTMMLMKLLMNATKQREINLT
jgi:hypothetical protein